MTMHVLSWVRACDGPVHDGDAKRILYKTSKCANVTGVNEGLHWLDWSFS